MEIELKAKADSKYNIDDIVSYRLYSDSDIFYLGFIINIQTTFHREDNSFTFEYLIFKLTGTMDPYNIDIVSEKNIICALSLDKINRLRNEFYDTYTETLSPDKINRIHNKCVEKEEHLC